MIRRRWKLAAPVLTVPLIASSLVLTLMAGVAWASWSATSIPGGHGSATATMVDRGATPTAVATVTAVTVNWAATTLSSGDPVAGYLINRYDTATLTLQTVAAGCAGPHLSADLHRKRATRRTLGLLRHPGHRHALDRRGQPDEPRSRPTPHHPAPVRSATSTAISPTSPSRSASPPVPTPAQASPPVNSNAPIAA